jgi:hypothetical protein
MTGHGGNGLTTLDQDDADPPWMVVGENAAEIATSFGSVLSVCVLLA